MRLCRPLWKDKRGKYRPVRGFYVEFTGMRGRVERVPAASDKDASQEFMQHLSKLLDLKRNNVEPDGALRKWIESLSPVHRARLQRIGLLNTDDMRRLTTGEPLSESLAAWERSLTNRGISPKQIAMLTMRAKAVLEGSKCQTWADISSGRVCEYLKARRDVGLGIQTSNFYAAAAKQFSRWFAGEHRLAENPLAYLKGGNVATDRRLVRRALTVEETRRLLRAAESGPRIRGMDGKSRAMLYTVAVRTGLRWNELYTLTVGSFDLAATPATVTVKADCSKHRREDVLPLRDDMAAELRSYFAGRLPTARAFLGMPKTRGAEMLGEDLANAGILQRNDDGKPINRDASGRVLDFHGLRHTFITNLAASGVHPSVAQALARHSTITLTMNRYTHTALESQTAALAALPDLNATEAERVAATGTENARADALPHTLPKSPGDSFSKRMITNDGDSSVTFGDNADADGEVMQKAGVEVVNLHHVANGMIGERAEDGLHWRPLARRAFAAAVASEIRGKYIAAESLSLVRVDDGNDDCY